MYFGKKGKFRTKQEWRPVIGKYQRPFDSDDEGYDDLEDDFGDSDDLVFADPGGTSALRAASRDNPRDRPCPTCGWPDKLTRQDVAQGYQCDECANAMERGGEIDFYPVEDDNDD